MLKKKIRNYSYKFRKMVNDRYKLHYRLFNVDEKIKAKKKNLITIVYHDSRYVVTKDDYKNGKYEYKKRFILGNWFLHFLDKILAYIERICE